MAKAVGFTGVKSDWSASGGRLVFTRENASVGIEWGKDGSGIDNTWYGDTSGAYMKWDESADDLLIVNAEARIASASITSAVLTTASMTTLTVASGGKLNLKGADSILVLEETVSRGTMTASTPDHWVQIGMVASGSVINVKIPVWASA